MQTSTASCIGLQWQGPAAVQQSFWQSGLVLCTMQLWQLWAGSSRVCWGRFLLCRAPCPAAVSLPLMVVLALAFIFLEAPRLSACRIFLEATAGLLLALSATSFVRAGLMDPGFLPRSHQLTAMALSSETRGEVSLQLYATSQGKGDERAAAAPNDDFRQRLLTVPCLEADENATSPDAEQAEAFWLSIYKDRRSLKVCETCNIRRPRICSHCKECDCCVQDFDHHCHWLGTCIGLRNHKTFLVFVVSPPWLL